MFDDSAFDDHERVLFVNDKASGLKAIIAVHSTALGPSAGGCRLWTYGASADALHDALRLSRGMSFKNAMAGLKFGGGKAVILGPIADEAREPAFQALGAAVDSLNGAYITAEDVGVKVADMEAVAHNTSYVCGLGPAGEGVGGDPSPHTARGVLRAVEASAKAAFGRSDLEGLRIAVQGLGAVGGNLCRLLGERGAKMIVADINDQRMVQICDETGAEMGNVDTILFADVDLVSPCALGGVFTVDNVSRVQAKAIAGGANNQLATRDAGVELAKRGIVYAPDYVVNAGGIIVVTAEYEGGGDKEAVMANIDAIGARLEAIFEKTKQTGEPTYKVADDMAREIIAKAS